MEIVWAESTLQRTWQKCLGATRYQAPEGCLSPQRLRPKLARPASVFFLTCPGSTWSPSSWGKFNAFKLDGASYSWLAQLAEGWIPTHVALAGWAHRCGLEVHKRQSEDYKFMIFWTSFVISKVSESACIFDGASKLSLLTGHACMIYLQSVTKVELKQKTLDFDDVAMQTRWLITYDDESAVSDQDEIKLLFLREKVAGHWRGHQRGENTRWGRRLGS